MQLEEQIEINNEHEKIIRSLDDSKNLFESKIAKIRHKSDQDIAAIKQHYSGMEDDSESQLKELLKLKKEIAFMKKNMQPTIDAQKQMILKYRDMFGISND